MWRWNVLRKLTLFSAVCCFMAQNVQPWKLDHCKQSFVKQLMREMEAFRNKTVLLHLLSLCSVCCDSWDLWLYRLNVVFMVDRLLSSESCVCSNHLSPSHTKLLALNEAIKKLLLLFFGLKCVLCFSFRGILYVCVYKKTLMLVWDK